jgi:mannose-1-phosphate guanylyltransferase
MDSQTTNQARWSIILAGGEGKRMASFISRWAGSTKPKQFCTFVGTRSMFEHTLDRVSLICRSENTVIVSQRNQQQYVPVQLRGRGVAKTILQPVNCETAPAIFAGLSYVRAYDPDAIVTIYPADHFIYPEHRFAQTVESAINAAATLRDRLVLLGAPPDKPERDYGIIQPSTPLGWSHGRRVWAVESFAEKPPGTRHDGDPVSNGALWNTMILTAHLKPLWESGCRCLPQLMPLFAGYSASVGTLREQSVLEAIYEKMPITNFSTDLLERIPKQMAVIELTGLLWSDWGRPERVLEMLSCIGKQPAFSVAPAAAAGCFSS